VGGAKRGPKRFNLEFLTLRAAGEKTQGGVVRLGGYDRGDHFYYRPYLVGGEGKLLRQGGYEREKVISR